MTTLVIGAPSLTGEDANAKAKQLFGDCEYPLEAQVINRTAFNLSLPEARLNLKPIGTENVVFADFSRLQRTVSSLAQIAELNKVLAIVTISTECLPAAEQGDDEDAAKALADAETERQAQEEKARQEAEEKAREVEEAAKREAEAAANAGKVTVIQDEGQTYVVELNGVRFEPNRNQVREDGTLTAGGLKAYEAAKAEAEKK